MTTSHPFGTSITEETLRQTFIPLSQWEDKYRQLILLGKRLPALSDDLKERAKEIAGCENRVWLGYTVDADGKLPFFGDSEGRIVRGMLAVLFTAVEGKSAAELLTQFPTLEALYQQLELTFILLWHKRHNQDAKVMWLLNEIRRLYHRESSPLAP